MPFGVGVAALPTPTGACQVRRPLRYSVARRVRRLMTNRVRTTRSWLRWSPGTQPVRPFGRIGMRMRSQTSPSASTFADSTRYTSGTPSSVSSRRRVIVRADRTGAVLIG